VPLGPASLPGGRAAVEIRPRPDEEIAMVEKVEAGKVVLIRYTVREKGTDAVLDTSGEVAYAYLHGRGNVVKGLEAALDGREVGEQFDVTVTPAEAYGDRKDGWPVVVPRSELKGVKDPRKGMPFRAQGSGGQSAVLWITDVRGSRVTIDANHPMAGKTLRFSGEILGVRNATPEEHEHGHAHGPTGHVHTD
jgi:FKBP-type peptidyl-prolyl cis-trans isomerase SlyD